MAKTLLELDDDLLAEATAALGASTKKETVTRALQAAVDASRNRRARALADLQQAAAEGAFDFALYEQLDQ